MADVRRQVSASSSVAGSRSSAATAALNAERDAVDRLTRSDLKASMTLLAQGVHPTALAQVITDLRAEGARGSSASASASAAGAATGGEGGAA